MLLRCFSSCRKLLATRISAAGRQVDHPITMGKRKRSSAITVEADPTTSIPPPIQPTEESKPSRRGSQRKQLLSTLDPDLDPSVKDAATALRASPDAEINRAIVSNYSKVATPSKASKLKKQASKIDKADSSQAEAKAKIGEMAAALTVRRTALKESNGTKKAKNEETADPEADDEDADADPEEIKQALIRPPPVNSDYLPLPWKGRLGYACLCTYLRNANPPVFSSRTTRIASILEHRHPLTDPSQPEHPTKNRPDKTKPADVRLGQEFVEKLCLANVRDMAKTLCWNDRYNIKFLRLSSEAFPFASHAEYGYKLSSFASEALAEVGKVVAELGHRVSMHPGQFTQLGSPRDQVIKASIRDLEYHDELLSLLKLPEQQDRDAVLVLHMGGTFGDKQATLDRFRENYKKLSPGIKKRLVLENDDMCWNVHDLLPICKELNIPFVLDFHHHNIIFDDTKIREGTKDIISLFPEIRETWTRKRITQKMHYSEPTPSAITPKQRRKHNPRVATLPPCSNDMDLMIEAKDKEQAVLELMRTFKLPGYDTFSDIQPHIRPDENKIIRPIKAKPAPKRGKKGAALQQQQEEEQEGVDEQTNGPVIVPEAEIAMGGPDGRVYWPPGMEEWLRPVKRVVKKKENVDGEDDGSAPPAKKKGRAAKSTLPNGEEIKHNGEEEQQEVEKPSITVSAGTPNGVKKATSKPAKKGAKVKREPSLSPTEDEEDDNFVHDEEEREEALPSRKKQKQASSRKSGRSRASRVSYKEEDEDS